MYEVYKRLKKEKGEQVALEVYAQMTRTKIAALDEQTALKAADVSLERGLAMADAIVYSTARAYSGQFITSDKDWKELPGVQYVE